MYTIAISYLVTWSISIGLSYMSYRTMIFMAERLR